MEPLPSIRQLLAIGKPTIMKRSPTRFSDASIAILTEWLQANSSYPYPTPEDKVSKERETELIITNRFF